MNVPIATVTKDVGMTASAIAVVGEIQNTVTNLSASIGTAW